MLHCTIGYNLQNLDYSLALCSKLVEEYTAYISSWFLVSHRYEKLFGLVSYIGSFPYIS